jgi:hypothetical protein
MKLKLPNKRISYPLHKDMESLLLKPFSNRRQ